MRFNRWCVSGVLLAFALLLSACQGDSGDNAADQTNSSGADVSASVSSSGPTKLTPHLSGDWQLAGDLCKIITGKVAADILVYDGTIVESYDPINIPANQGVDACAYRDPSAKKGLGTIVGVMRITEDQWLQARYDAEAKGSFIEFSIEGFDGALVTAENQALVRKGEFMGLASNSSVGRFEPAGLVMLAAHATSIVG